MVKALLLFGLASRRQKSSGRPPREDGRTNRRETSLRGELTLDVRNTGRAVSLALLDYSSGAARGCDFRYYDTVANGRIGVPGESRNLLMAAQDIDLTGARLKEYSDPSERKAGPISVRGIAAGSRRAGSSTTGGFSSTRPPNATTAVSGGFAPCR